MNEDMEFVKRLYPTAVYDSHAFWVCADTIEAGKKRTYILGIGGNAKNGWTHAAQHLRNRVLRQFES